MEPENRIVYEIYEDRVEGRRVSCDSMAAERLCYLGVDVVAVESLSEQIKQELTYFAPFDFDLAAVQPSV